MNAFGTKSHNNIKWQNANPHWRNNFVKQTKKNDQEDTQKNIIKSAQRSKNRGQGK